MKKIRVILLAFICIVFSVLQLRAQQFYYSAGEKNYIYPDSTTIILETKKEDAQNILKRILIANPNLRRLHQFKNSELVEVKFEKPIKLNETSIQGAEKVMYGYKMGDNPFYLTGEILLMPKDGVDITHIIRFVQNKIYVSTSTKYNTYKMGVYDWSEIIELSNSIY